MMIENSAGAGEAGAPVATVAAALAKIVVQPSATLPNVEPEPAADDPAVGAVAEPGTQPALPEAIGSAPDYTAEHAAETLHLCAVASLSLQDAMAFVTAKLPVAQVRAQLAERAAAAADQLAIDTSREPAADGSGWDDVIAKMNTRYGVARNGASTK